MVVDIKYLILGTLKKKRGGGGRWPERVFSLLLFVYAFGVYDNVSFRLCVYVCVCLCVCAGGEGE